MNFSVTVTGVDVFPSFGLKVKPKVKTSVSQGPDC